jgi:hypothetical protein
VCLGDGHDGVWNSVQEFGTEKSKPLEILDWYHLKENLYQVGGSLKRLQLKHLQLKRLQAVETLLW